MPRICLYQNILAPRRGFRDTGAVLPAGIPIGVGVRTRRPTTHHGSRQLATTSILRLAINGKGYSTFICHFTDAYNPAPARSRFAPDGPIVTDRAMWWQTRKSPFRRCPSVDHHRAGQFQRKSPDRTRHRPWTDRNFRGFPSLRRTAGAMATISNTETPASARFSPDWPGSTGYALAAGISAKKRRTSTRCRRAP